MADEYKKFDTHDIFTIHNARLAKDATVIEGGEKPMVKLTFVVTSRSDRHSDMWVEATVQDRNSDLASHFKKGDIVGLTGKLALRKWGDNNEKQSVELLRAEVHPTAELFAAAKERGWTPGAARNQSDKPAAKKTTTPAKKPAAKAKKEIVDLDEE